MLQLHQIGIYEILFSFKHKKKQTKQNKNLDRENLYQHVFFLNNKNKYLNSKETCKIVLSFSSCFIIINTDQRC